MVNLCRRSDGRYRLRQSSIIEATRLRQSSIIEATRRNGWKGRKGQFAVAVTTGPPSSPPSR
jgi:hypothetical protein